MLKFMVTGGVLLIAVLVDARAHGQRRGAGRVSQAAGVISREHGALTLRTLQTLAEVATEHSSTLVLPIPMDMLETARGDVAPDPNGGLALAQQSDRA